MNDIDLTTKNMALWRLVEKTNPSHTKKVTFGRAITAIDPYRQIEAATAQFGPAAQGWGWEVKLVHELTETKQVGILVKVWIKPDCRDDQLNSIEQWGQSGIYIDNACKKKDEDCFKKATTDGITKCLSYMGFNADIFLGKFDDNKYVKEREEDCKKEDPAYVPSPHLMAFRKCKTMDDLKAAHAKVAKNEWSKEVKDAFAHQKDLLKKGE